MAGIEELPEELYICTGEEVPLSRSLFQPFQGHYCSFIRSFSTPENMSIFKGQFLDNVWNGIR